MTLAEKHRPAAATPRISHESGSNLVAETTVELTTLASAMADLELSLKVPLPAARVAHALAETCNRFCDSNSPISRHITSTIASSRGWSPALLAESMRALLAPFAVEALLDLAAHSPHQNRLIGMVMPGNLPGSGLHEVVAAMLAGCAVFVKSARIEPSLYPAFAQTLREVDEHVGRRLAALVWGRERTDLTAAMRAACDWLAAFGTDDTLAALSEGGAAAPLAAGFGQRFSGAVVAADCATVSVADALARDVCLFEQQGCLSPHHVFIEASAGDRVAIDFAARLADAIERFGRRFAPPFRYDLESAAAVRRVREAARWRALGERGVELWEGPGLSWTVVFDGAAGFQPSPGYRTVTISPINSLNDLKDRLEPFVGRIEAFAVAASDGSREAFERLLRSLGVCYLCRPGQMQSPPLDWNHGGGAFGRALAAR